jgi:hypothetical protein
MLSQQHITNNNNDDLAVQLSKSGSSSSPLSSPAASLKRSASTPTPALPFAWPPSTITLLFLSYSASALASFKTNFSSSSLVSSTSSIISS